MEGKSRFGLAVLALFTAFCLVCATWYLARNSSPEPWLISSARRPAAEEPAASEPEDVPYPDSLLPGEVIDVNTADIYDLQRLPGIGEKRAQEIIAYREEHGPFRTVDNLTEVTGIGPAILETLREYVTAGDE